MADAVVDVAVAEVFQAVVADAVAEEDFQVVVAVEGIQAAVVVEGITAAEVVLPLALVAVHIMDAVDAVIMEDADGMAADHIVATDLMDTEATDVVIIGHLQAGGLLTVVGAGDGAGTDHGGGGVQV